jgi:hypothetical protein
MILRQAKFRSGTHPEEYVVLIDGEEIGSVWKWERHYNLSRRYVTRGWRARTKGGRQLFSSDGTTAQTRAEAAARLASEIQQP